MDPTVRPCRVDRARGGRVNAVRSRFAFGLLAAVLLLAAHPRRADAIPSFSMQTCLQCDACHTATRATNELGEAYLRNDLRLGNLGAGGKPVVALRGQLAYTSEPDSGGLPKATVDEVEAFIAARVTREVSVAGQFYLTDGGRPGSVREAWVQYAPHGTIGGAPLRVTAGSITLPLPVDPETFRQTNEHYAIFDQTVGANPFAFIDARLERTFALRAEAIGLQYARGPRIDAINISNGRRITIAVFASAGAP